MHQLTVILLLGLFLIACNNKPHPQEPATTKEPFVCFTDDSIPDQGTLRDTQVIAIANTSIETILDDLFSHAYVPDSSKLQGIPFAYLEWINPVANWSKEEYERMAKVGWYVDTTDRDFDKYWYNEKGLLCKYERWNYGDMAHSETLFTYYPDGTIKKLSINNVPIPARLYTLYFDRTRITVIQHNLVKTNLVF